MRLLAARLRDFRLLRIVDIAPGAGLTVVFGENAQGKTTILEGISYLSTGRSFRTRSDRECIPLSPATGEFARVEGEFESRGSRHEIRVVLSSEGKTLWLDDKQVRALSDVLGMLASVVIAPGDIEIVRGTAARRRAFMDLILAQTDPRGFRALADYDRALRGRNVLLRRPGSPRGAEMAAFESVMAESATYLWEARRRTTTELSAAAAECVLSVTAGAEALTVEYEPGWPAEDGVADADFRKLWTHDRAGDIERGHTRRGPHRDDYPIMVAGTDTRKFASQGQCRTAALALRLAEAELLRQRLGEPPLLMLDDVLGELDQKRTAVFLRELSRLGMQAILTTTDATPLEHAGVEGHARLRLSGGTLEAC